MKGDIFLSAIPRKTDTGLPALVVALCSISGLQMFIYKSDAM